MDINKAAKVKQDAPQGKVIVEFDGVKREVLEELVTECSSGSCSCGSEEFLTNVDGFTLSEDGKTIEITGKVSAEEVSKTLKEWNKTL
jgi:hypothetical protein